MTLLRLTGVVQFFLVNKHTKYTLALWPDSTRVENNPPRVARSMLQGGHGFGDAG